METRVPVSTACLLAFQPGTSTGFMDYVADMLLMYMSYLRLLVVLDATESFEGTDHAKKSIAKKLHPGPEDSWLTRG